MLFATNTAVATNKDGIDLAKGINMLIDAGFPALDLSLSGDYDFVLADNYKDNAARIKSLADSRGVVFNQSHAPFRGYEIYSTQIRPILPRVIEFAGLVGAKAIVVHPLMPMRHYGHVEELFELNMDFYSSLAPYAKNAGIKIAIENMWNRHPITKNIEDAACSDPYELARYYDSLDDPEAFTVCLDIGHVALCGREPEDAIRIIGGDRLGAIHAHDVNYLSDLHTLPGVSKVNFDAVCRALADINYKGDFTLESEGFAKGFDNEYLPTVFKFMAETACYYRNKVLRYMGKDA